MVLSYLIKRKHLQYPVRFMLPDFAGTGFAGRTIESRKEKRIKKGRHLSRPFLLEFKEVGYTLRVLNISTIITITRTAPMAITTHTQAGVVGGTVSG